MSTAEIIQIQIEVCGSLLQRLTKQWSRRRYKYSIRGSKYFDYKTSITEILKENNAKKEVEIYVPLKHLSNFWIYH